jgi:hypothetical protein
MRAGTTRSENILIYVHRTERLAPAKHWRRMARYFMHLLNGHGLELDREGVELPDVEAARRHALQAGVDIVASELKDGCPSVHLTVYVDDEANERILTLPISATAGGAETSG